MTQRPGEETTPRAERAEQLVQQAGQRLGHLAWQARQRWQHALQAFREEADRMDVPASAPAGQRSARAGATQATQTKQARTERAEELVDRVGQRLGLWAKANGIQARRTLARLRESAEDFWVEAQDIRAGWERERAQAPRAPKEGTESGEETGAV